MYKEVNPQSQVSGPTNVLTPNPPAPSSSSNSNSNRGGNGREVSAPTSVLSK